MTNLGMSSAGEVSGKVPLPGLLAKVAAAGPLLAASLGLGNGTAATKLRLLRGCVAELGVTVCRCSARGVEAVVSASELGAGEGGRVHGAVGVERRLGERSLLLLLDGRLGLGLLHRLLGRLLLRSPKLLMRRKHPDAANGNEGERRRSSSFPLTTFSRARRDEGQLFPLSLA